MANQPRPKAKRSRALGIALTPKCQKYLENRPYPPGPHGRSRKSTSDYKVRLMEKQRLRAQYNISEKAMRRAFDLANKKQGRTGEVLVASLESRLDATVLRSGFARTIYQARQVVGHQHVHVNGRRVDRPGYLLSPGDVVSIAPGSRDKAPFQLAAAGAHTQIPPGYLSVQLAELTAVVLRPPVRNEIPVICEEQLVVEFYAR
jgi:small subunit ribosomal protein S4